MMCSDDLYCGQVQHDADAGFNQYDKSHSEKFRVWAEECKPKPWPQDASIPPKESPNFSFSCIGCCCKYLKERNYTCDCPNKFPGRVVIGDGNPRLECLVAKPKKYGSVRLVVPPVLVRPKLARPVADSVSYQLYDSDGTQFNIHPKAMGSVFSAQVEAIQVEKIAELDFNDAVLILQGCHFSYCDAALHEMWRHRAGYESLKGNCGELVPMAASAALDLSQPLYMSESIKTELQDYYSQ